YVDVFAAQLGDSDGVQYLLANQPLADGAGQPVAQFSLERARGDVPVFRSAGTCGDRLATSGDELLGWARADAGDGTAGLGALAGPVGSAFVYGPVPGPIATLGGEGYTVVGTVAHVWPPGMGDAPFVEPDAPEPANVAAPAPCSVTKHSALQLLYASPG